MTDTNTPSHPLRPGNEAQTPGFKASPSEGATTPADQRLHIAAMAMQGLLAYGTPNNSPRYVARHALSYADALINEHINTSK